MIKTWCDVRPGDIVIWRHWERGWFIVEVMSNSGTSHTFGVEIQIRAMYAFGPRDFDVKTFQTWHLFETRVGDVTIIRDGKTYLMKDKEELIE